MDDKQLSGTTHDLTDDAKHAAPGVKETAANTKTASIDDVEEVMDNKNELKEETERERGEL